MDGEVDGEEDNDKKNEEEETDEHLLLTSFLVVVHSLLEVAMALKRGIWCYF